MDPATTDTGLRLLVVDAPNMDMSLGELLGRKPFPQERLRFDVLGDWFARRAGAGEDVEGCYFINVVPERAPDIRSWVWSLREAGYAVFAKPKVGDSDIDHELQAHVERRSRERRVTEVIVASGDQGNRELLSTLAAHGVAAAVLGFAEKAPWALSVPGVGFVDLRDVPGVFTVELPREPILEKLPPEGAWFKPLRPLGRRPVEV